MHYNPANALALLLSDSPPTQALRDGWRRLQSRAPGPNLYFYLEEYSALNQTLVSCAADSCYKECQLCVGVHVCACVDAHMCVFNCQSVSHTLVLGRERRVFLFEKPFLAISAFSNLSYLLLTPFLSAFTFPSCVTKLSPGTHSQSSPSRKHFPLTRCPLSNPSQGLHERIIRHEQRKWS